MLQALKRWAREAAGKHPEILRVGYTGSLCRGDWGVGSDVDVVVVAKRKDRDLHRRLFFSLLSLPVPADLLLYTEEDFDYPPLRRFLKETVWLETEVENEDLH